MYVDDEVYCFMRLASWTVTECGKRIQQEVPDCEVRIQKERGRDEEEEESVAF